MLGKLLWRVADFRIVNHFGVLMTQKMLAPWINLDLILIMADHDDNDDDDANGHLGSYRFKVKDITTNQAK